jgi:hypothetical protein
MQLRAGREVSQPPPTLLLGRKYGLAVP